MYVIYVFTTTVEVSDRPDQPESSQVLVRVSFQTRYYSARLRVKVKVKLSQFLTKYHAMKAYWGSGGIVPRIL
jgi:hypothetical protein